MQEAAITSSGAACRVWGAVPGSGLGLSLVRRGPGPRILLTPRRGCCGRGPRLGRGGHLAWPVPASRLLIGRVLADQAQHDPVDRRLDQGDLLGTRLVCLQPALQLIHQPRAPGGGNLGRLGAAAVGQRQHVAVAAEVAGGHDLVVEGPQHASRGRRRRTPARRWIPP